jgi:hypothetical protein
MHEYAFSELQALHKEAERWDELIDLYVTRIEATEDRGERIELLRAAARVYEEKLDSGEQAYHTLYIAWTEDFANKNTATDLERVTAANEKWNELLTSANQVLQEGHEPETQIAICLCCAKWYGQDLGHPEYAIPWATCTRPPSSGTSWRRRLRSSSSSRATMRSRPTRTSAWATWQTIASPCGKRRRTTTAGRYISSPSTSVR